ncbi:hypothetical protein [Sphingomonas sp.]|nr:hypothetical protein [Sphingomonas sp.]
MAARAGVKEVVLTHIVPGFDDETATTQYSDGVKRVFGGPVIVASDLRKF